MPAPTPSKAIILGSINVDDNKQAFTLAAKNLGTKLKYLPDGETGHRLSFIFFQREKVPKRVFRDYREATDEDHIVAKLDTPLTLDEFEPNTYDTEAIASYKVFCGLRDQGLIKQGQKFQVCVPGPLDITRASIKTGYCLEAEPFIEKRMEEALRVIQDNIPAQDLCLQWDLPGEVMLLEHSRLNDKYRHAFMPYFEGDVLEGMVSRLARISAHIRPEVELGVHLCYGDYGHEHFVQPTDAGVLTTLTNAITAKLESVHKISYFHLPVPKDRDDAAYFEPLKKLAFDGDLYLGVVQDSDEDGSRKRMEAAREVLDREFGVSTECGLGRCPKDAVEPTMQILDSITTG